jgi:rubredoxin
MFEGLRKWRQRRVLQPRPGDKNCRVCGGLWVLQDETPELQGVVIPSSTPVAVFPAVVVGGQTGFTTWRCEGCGAFFQEET